jgi:hypothetical protein
LLNFVHFPLYFSLDNHIDGHSDLHGRRLHWSFRVRKAAWSGDTAFSGRLSSSETHLIDRTTIRPNWVFPDSFRERFDTAFEKVLVVISLHLEIASMVMFVVEIGADLTSKYRNDQKHGSGRQQFKGDRY